jgi:hypothetical protein
MRRRASAGRVKAAGWRFGSAPSECGRAVDDCLWRGDADRGRRRLMRDRGRRNPGGPVLGRKAVVTWAGFGISRENRDGLPWPLG